MAKEKTLEDLFHDTLKDIYYAERKILKALPKMAKAAESPDLKAGFEEHLEITRGQVERLETIFEERVAGGTTRIISPTFDLSQHPEARITYSRWFFSMVGTTDTPVSEPSFEPRALDQEINFILTHAAMTPGWASLLVAGVAGFGFALFFAQKSKCVQGVMLRGSSII